MPTGVGNTLMNAHLVLVTPVYDATGVDNIVDVTTGVDNIVHGITGLSNFIYSVKDTIFGCH